MSGFMTLLSSTWRAKEKEFCDGKSLRFSTKYMKSHKTWIVFDEIPDRFSRLYMQSKGTGITFSELLAGPLGLHGETGY